MEEMNSCTKKRHYGYFRWILKDAQVYEFKRKEELKFHQDQNTVINIAIQVHPDNGLNKLRSHSLRVPLIKTCIDQLLKRLSSKKKNFPKGHSLFIKKELTFTSPWWIPDPIPCYFWWVVSLNTHNILWEGSHKSNWIDEGKKSKEVK